MITASYDRTWKLWAHDQTAEPERKSQIDKQAAPPILSSEPMQTEEKAPTESMMVD